jgi:hypothetical protein
LCERADRERVRIAVDLDAEPVTIPFVSEVHDLELSAELALAPRELVDALVDPRADRGCGLLRGDSRRLAARCRLETECDEDSAHGS